MKAPAVEYGDVQERLSQQMGRIQALRLKTLAEECEQAPKRDPDSNYRNALMSHEEIRSGGVRIGADWDPGCLPNSRNRSTGWPHVARGPTSVLIHTAAIAPRTRRCRNTQTGNRMRSRRRCAPRRRVMVQ
jgi:hypothetical protein